MRQYATLGSLRHCVVQQQYTFLPGVLLTSTTLKLSYGSANGWASRAAMYRQRHDGQPIQMCSAVKHGADRGLGSFCYLYPSYHRIETSPLPRRRLTGWIQRVTCSLYIASQTKMATKNPTSICVELCTCNLPNLLGLLIQLRTLLIR